MFLKRIELQNFKSFSQKTVLEFPTLITAIVGPNGSGKSNIIDALRWVLGEQSLKNLRVEKSEDLIYSSSQKEKNANFTEVSVIFDNHHQVFPFDFSEFSFTRRIDREGVNSYFLNNTPCRLKDVVEATAMAKFGVKGISIINQGAGENILRVSPEERRVMLEEILGLKSLEIKKEEAKRKLERTILNLDKAKALYQELLPHLRSLKRQIARWDKKSQIREELRQLEERYFLQIFQEIEDYKKNDFPQLEEIREKIKILENKIIKEETELRGVQGGKGEELDRKIVSLTEEIIALQNKKSSFLRDLGRLEGQVGLKLGGKILEEKIKKIIKKLENALLVENIVTIKELIKEVLHILNKEILISGDVEKRESIQLTEKELIQLDSEIENKKKTLAKLQNGVSRRNENFNQKLQQLETRRREKESLIYQIHKAEIQREKYDLRIEEFRRHLEEAGWSFEELKIIYDKNKNQLAILAADDFRFLEAKILRLRRESAELGAIDQNILTEYNDLSQRCSFLASQIEDLEKSIKDLRHLIKELNAQIIQELTAALKEINEAFNRYFQLLFRGGKAKLEFREIKKNISENNSSNDDEMKYSVPQELGIPAAKIMSAGSNDISHSTLGIDIKIDIPKTKLKSLEMLSGGEKSLVAISLLFAIVNKSNPPLLIIDEIDAALDEDNSRRFAEILKELSKKTQFIIITHNRLTMAVAEIIYGVTISENNSSQIFSLQFREAQEYHR